MSIKIITISREFGSGGRSIGKAVAQRLGIPYYDKELIKKVAEETGFDERYIEETGEYAPGKTSLPYLLTTTGPNGLMGGLSSSSYLWVMQRNVILQLANRSPCVIVGRCSDYILKDRTDCLNVFIHAQKEFRAERIVRLYGQTKDEPEKRLAQKDDKRRINYKHFTGQTWGMSQNYHLSLDSGKIGINTCVEILEKLVRANDE